MAKYYVPFFVFIVLILAIIHPLIYTKYTLYKQRKLINNFIDYVIGCENEMDGIYVCEFVSFVIKNRMLCAFETIFNNKRSIKKFFEINNPRLYFSYSYNWNKLYALDVYETNNKWLEKCNFLKEYENREVVGLLKYRLKETLNIIKKEYNEINKIDFDLSDMC